MKIKVGQIWWDAKRKRRVRVGRIDAQGTVYSANDVNGFVLRPMTPAEFLARGFVLREDV